MDVREKRDFPGVPHRVYSDTEAKIEILLATFFKASFFLIACWVYPYYSSSTYKIYTFPTGRKVIYIRLLITS